VAAKGDDDEHNNSGINQDCCYVSEMVKKYRYPVDARCLQSCLVSPISL
jgi:hypothetical protein